ncbi:MAG: glycosyltransferase family 2 protein [Chloroflexota bacterium]
MGPLYRAYRLLRLNPRLFARRLAVLLRHPLLYSQNTVGTLPRRRRTQESYNSWLGTQPPHDVPSSADVAGPLLSVVMPVHDVPEPLLEAAITSVTEQTYTLWELCIADDASVQPHVKRVLQKWSEADSRIRVVYRDVSGHISAASNSAIDIARGEFVVLLDHDDCLSCDALADIAHAILSDPEVDFVYSDEDKLDETGQRVQPFFKPAWSPTLLTSCNYITHLAAIRRSLVLHVGGFHDDMVGSQDHDLFLRVGECARKVAHIPRILYSWRMAPGSTAQASTSKPYAIDAGRRSLQRTIERRALRAHLETTMLNGIFVIRHGVPKPVRISLVVLGRSRRWEKVLPGLDYSISDITYLDTTVDRPEGYHIVETVNDAGGDYLIFIDSASRARRRSTLTALLEPLQLHGVAVSGGTTVLGRNMVLQAGLALGDGGQPFYTYSSLYRLPYPDFYLNLKDLPREVSAAWVGCCALRADIWRDLGGWAADLPPPLALADLCLRAREKGQSTIFTPLAVFDRDVELPTLPSVRDHRWSWRELQDPFWNPNLMPGTADGLPFRHDSAARTRTLSGTCGQSGG